MAGDGIGVVVGAAVISDGRVLAARRTRPAHVAGRWELPGGAVEPGEREGDALARELREELALPVEVGERIGPDVALPGDRVLRIHRCTTTGTPVPGEHDALRWLAAGELDDVDWLPADRDVLPALRTALRTDAGLRPAQDLRRHGPSSAPS